MTKTEKIIFSLIVLLPIIDMITSFTVNLPLSLGALLRTGFMFFLFFYMIIYLQKESFILLSVFLLSFISIAMTLIINFMLKRPFMLTDEIQFGVKTGYYIIMIFTALFIVDRRLINKGTVLHASSIAAIIMGISYWIAIITKTDIPSYTYIKAGYSGWFYSANELSVIIIILLTLTIIYFHEKRTFLPLIAFSFILSMIPMIGTKTAFYGAIIIIISFFALSIFTKQIKQNLPLLAVTIVGILFLPLTPYMTNNKVTESPIEKTEKTEQDIKFQQMMSSRDIYLEDIKADYLQATPIRKLVGLGYAGDYEKNPKMIEMDFFDLFFSYGIIGTFIILLSLPILLNRLLAYRRTITYLVSLLALGLIGGISFVAGHVMFAPAVMTYVAILAIVIGLEARKPA